MLGEHSTIELHPSLRKLFVVSNTIYLFVCLFVCFEVLGFEPRTYTLKLLYQPYFCEGFLGFFCLFLFVF
jgi:hypothetical protein